MIGPFWSLTKSQMYRELAAMAADGLIEADEVGPRDRLLLTLAFSRHLPPERLAQFTQHHRATHAERLT